MSKVLIVDPDLNAQVKLVEIAKKHMGDEDPLTAISLQAASELFYENSQAIRTVISEMILPYSDYAAIEYSKYLQYAAEFSMKSSKMSACEYAKSLSLLLFMEQYYRKYLDICGGIQLAKNMQAMLCPEAPVTTPFWFVTSLKRQPFNNQIEGLFVDEFPIWIVKQDDCQSITLPIDLISEN